MLVNYGTLLLFLVLAIDGAKTQRCGVNEVFEDARCEPYCDNALDDPCYQQVERSGCFCQTGYIRDQRTKKCIRLEQCSSRVCRQPYMELDLNGRFTICSGPRQSYTGYPYRRKPACACISEYAESRGGCIPISQCRRLERN
ncbi:uncharacterized protein LOC111625674 [Centruroides sculpturatus]|uniref:uncharacterized protein LOC111625674 n=1 Tax=Centruroides sculpturatus TaxID=218467 RepID=UPI000C6D103E|nr:uncharacterized protein LOC111625674 [Centruroides sculpturatus]